MSQQQQNLVMKNRENVLKQSSQIKNNAKISADTTGGGIAGKGNLPLIQQQSL